MYRLAISSYIIILFLSVSAYSQPNLKINEFMASNLNCCTDEYGDYDDWIEIYNPTDLPIDLSGYYLTDDYSNASKWKIPQGHSDITIVPAHGFLVLWADNQSEQGPLHLGFRLSSAGEQLALADKSGYSIIDSVSYNTQTTDISMGRFPDGDAVWMLYDQSTPALSNPEGHLGVANPPVFSEDASIFNGMKTISLFSDDPALTIFFTLDGSDPNASSNIYNGPIVFDTTIVIRARAFKEKYIASDIVTNTYITNSTQSLPVLSIVTDPKNLWDDSTGIYVHYDSTGRLWERKVHNQYLKNNELQFSLNSGIRIQGSTSRWMRKKSFRLFFRKGYDQERLEYDMFEDPSVTSFKNLVLRAGYDEDLTRTEGTLLRDPLVSELWRKTGQLVSLGNFAILYLNGDYWGIYNIRESLNEHFVCDHLGYQDFDLIRYTKFGSTYGIELKHGTLDDWNELSEFFNNNDISNDFVYEEACRRIDIDNYTTLHALVQCTEYYSWGYGVFVFKERKPGAKWYWTIWDMDRAYTSYTRNEFSRYDFPTSYWYYLILNRLLQNERYKTFFINRLCDLLNTVFLPDNVISLIDSLVAVVEPEIPAESERWNCTVDRWYTNIQSLREFARQRPAVVRSQMSSYFNLGNQHELALDVSPEGGEIQINSIQITKFPWKGTYFEGNPVTIKVLPLAGYRFKGWSDPNLLDSSFLIVHLSKNLSLTALFEEEPNGDRFEIIAPSKMKSGEHFPIVVRLYDNNTLNTSFSEELRVISHCALTDTTVKFKKGVGTLNPLIVGTNSFDLFIKDDLSSSEKKTVQIQEIIPSQSYAGTLSEGVHYWDSTHDRHIMADLTIPKNTQLVIKPDTRVLLDAKVNVFVHGDMTINGTKNEPVLFMSSSPDEPWGGFEFYGTTVQMRYCFWINGGGDSEKAWKHCQEFGIQPMLFAKDDAELFLENVFILFSPNGKAIGSEYSKVNVNQCIISNVFHGGEYWYTLLHYKNSHIINIPSDDRIYIQDEDNDGMHIDYEYPGPEKLSTIENCYFISGKDDAIDHQNAYLEIKNCWLEDWIHEGVAASNEGNSIAGRNSISLFNVIVKGCDRGFEVGHGSPRVAIDHCVAVDNNEGIRFGDGYSKLSEGHVSVTNSIVFNNTDNIRNFVRDLQGPRENAIDVSFSMTNDPDYNDFPHCITGIPLFDKSYRLLAHSPGTGMGMNGTNLGIVDSIIAHIGSIVINEIMYRPSDDMDSKDWIELYNPQSVAQNMSGWVLKDNIDENGFDFPVSTIIDPHGYLVICGDTTMFKNVYPNAINRIGNIDFGFGQGDQVRLYAITGQIVDSVNYDINPPWPTSPNGNGPSMELIDFTKDNNWADNWSASKSKGGTPGSGNSISAGFDEQKPTLPQSYSLQQNYPNPFNHNTAIEFTLPERSRVSLEIYNVIGQRVNVLIDDTWKNAGKYKMHYTIENLASGVYLYRLTTDNAQTGFQILTRKMVFLQ